MPDGEPLWLDVADPGNGVDFDDELAAVSGGSSDIGLSIELIPGPQPGATVYLSAALLTSSPWHSAMAALAFL